MISYLIDINVWLALTWDQHPQHRPASRWFASVGDARLLFSRFTMFGLLRLLTNRQVMGGSTQTLSGALALYDAWRADPRVDLIPEPPETEVTLRAILAKRLHETATKAIADTYLIALAKTAGVSLVSFDKELSSAARAENVPAALLKPATQ